MDRFAPRPSTTPVAEQAVRWLFLEVPVWSVGVVAVFFAPSLWWKAAGGAAAAIAIAALIRSLFAVASLAPRDRVVRSERRRNLWRRDLSLAREAARQTGDDPFIAEGRVDAAAVIAEEAIARTLTTVPTDALVAELQAVDWPMEEARTAADQGRWGDVIAMSVAIRLAADLDFDARWPAVCARLDEAWRRPTTGGGG